MKVENFRALVSVDGKGVTIRAEIQQEVVVFFRHFKTSAALRNFLSVVTAYVPGNQINVWREGPVSKVHIGGVGAVLGASFTFQEAFDRLLEACVND